MRAHAHSPLCLAHRWKRKCPSLSRGADAVVSCAAIERAGSTARCTSTVTSADTGRNSGSSCVAGAGAVGTGLFYGRPCWRRAWPRHARCSYSERVACWRGARTSGATGVRACATFTSVASVASDATIATAAGVVSVASVTSSACNRSVAGHRPHKLAHSAARPLAEAIQRSLPRAKSQVAFTLVRSCEGEGRGRLGSRQALRAGTHARGAPLSGGQASVRKRLEADSSESSKPVAGCRHR